MRIDIVDGEAVLLLISLWAEGLDVWLSASGRLCVSPSYRLNPHLESEIERHVEALRTLLACYDIEVKERQAVFVAELYSAQRRGVPPTFAFVAGVSPVAGRCQSCGCALETRRFGSCFRCALALRLALGTDWSPDALRHYDEARVVS